MTLSTLPYSDTPYASEDLTLDSKLQKHQRVLIGAFDSPAEDAYGRWRVSNPTTIWDSKLTGLDDAPLFWQEIQVSGSSTAPTTPTAAKPYIDLASINTTAGVYVRQTYRRFRNQPGKGQLIFMTGVLELASGTKTGCERRIGFFDNNNGLFFESDAGTIGVTERTNDSGSPVDDTTAQASWNLDTMDGVGGAGNPSGDTLDWTKAQIFVIDFQWPLGRTRFGVEIHGAIHYVHEHLEANVANIPNMSTSSLPLRYELISTSSSGVCSMRAISAAVISEGGTEDTGAVHHSSTRGAGVSTDTENVFFAVIGIRLEATHVGTEIVLLDAALQIHTASETLLWVLLWNPTVAGTFAYSDIANSSVQRALGAGVTNTVTGGVHMGGGFIESGAGGAKSGSGGGFLNTSLHLGVDYAGTALDEIVLCVMPIGSTSTATVEGSLTWREHL